VTNLQGGTGSKAVMEQRTIQDMSTRELIQRKRELERRERLKKEKRYNKNFVAWIESKCQEDGDIQPVDEGFYESFVSLTDEDLEGVVRVILHATAGYINKQLSSDEWDDDDLFDFVMLFLELIAEGKLAFHIETGKTIFLEPVGDPPSEDMWNKIQERITSSRSAIHAAIVKNVLSRRGD